jgi:hypothetical protein
MSRTWTLKTDEIAALVVYSGTGGYFLADALASTPQSSGRAIVALGLWVVLLTGLLVHYRRKSRRRSLENAG